MQKNIIKINESTLRKIVAESIMKALSEAKKGYTTPDDTEYWGVHDNENGGLFKNAMRSKKIVNTGKPIGNWQADPEKASSDTKRYMTWREKNRANASAVVSESALRKIAAESVKRVLNEGIFGNKIVEPNVAYNELCSIAQKYGYDGVKYKNGGLLIVATDRNGEPSVFGTRITLPQNVGSGMFGTGAQGWDMKSYQNLKQQLINYCERVKRTNAEVADERAKEWKEEQEYKKRKPEQQKQIDRSAGLPGGVFRGEDGRLYGPNGLVSGGIGYNPYTQSYTN